MARHELAMVAIVKNESHAIFDWLAHHAALGVDHFYLYENGSTDDTVAEIRAFPDQRRITLIPWPMKFGQIPAYQDALKRFGQHCRWMAFTDADEFFIPLQGEGLPAILARLGAASALAVPWTLFGSNGHDRRPAGSILENYTRRAPLDLDINRHVKMILRPDAARPGFPSPHVVRLRHGKRVREDGVEVEETEWRLPEPYAPRRLRLHHYAVQSRQDFENKVARGVAIDQAGRDDGFFAAHDRNEVEDTTALAFMPAIRHARALRDQAMRSPLKRWMGRWRRRSWAMPIAPV